MKGRRHRMKLPHIALAREFDFESAIPTIISKATNPKVLNFLPQCQKRIDAMHTSTDPIPTTSAPMEITIHVRR